MISAVWGVAGVVSAYFIGLIFDRTLGPQHSWTELVSSMTILYAWGYFAPAICRSFFPALVSQAEIDYVRTLNEAKQLRLKKGLLVLDAIHIRPWRWLIGIVAFVVLAAVINSLTVAAFGLRKVPHTELRHVGVLHAAPGNTGDVGCGNAEGTRYPMFRASAPSISVGRLVRYPNGLTLRGNVALKISVERDRTGALGRVLQVISEGVSQSLVGKVVLLKIGTCIEMPNPGDEGIVFGTLNDEDAMRPSFSPY